MKKFLMTGVALAVLAGAAQAADLPSRNRQPVAPPPVALPIFTWTGLYVGLNAGYAFEGGDQAHHRGDALTFAAVNAGQLPYGIGKREGGFIGGGQIGYNYQYGNIVVGAETDIQYLGSDTTKSFTGTGGILSTFKQEQTYLGTLRARLGFTPMDRLLIYGTGGLAYGDVKTNANISNAATGAIWGGSRDEVKYGWTLGAGAEYAFTNNLTAKAEYLYYDLGKTHLYHGALNGAATVARPGFGAVSGDVTGHIARVGLNYKF